MFRGKPCRAAACAFGLAALIAFAADRAAAQTHASMSPGLLPQAAAPGTIDRYGTVFDEWVAHRQPKTAFLVVRRNGQNVFARGFNADPLKPTMIASLSKPITGACVATLIRDGKMSFTTRIRDALSRFFNRYGAPADPRLGQVTVEQLLVHRSGLVGNGDDDPIYGVVAKRAQSGKGYLATVQAVLSEYLVKLHLIRDPGSRYAYSNTGYEVLSAMIEERSGLSYEDYCRDAVFGRLGIADARLDSNWRMLSGAGGWSIPGPDYLAFFDVFSPTHPFLGDRVKSWIDRAQTKWTPDNRDRWYGLGVNVWSGAGRWTVSHGGILNSQGKDAEGKPTEASVVSHAYRSPDGTAVFIALNWSPRAQEALDELRERIGSTHKLVTALPENSSTPR
jgi:CubicO group peptidase (beta-lactamase class C family)